MCKRYKVRPQIDIPVGIFQLSRVIELEIDIDRLRSPSAPCAAYRPCPPLTAFAPRRLCLLGARYARTPVAHAPCASAAPPCPPFGYASLRVAVAPWHGLSAKSVGANAPPPRLRCCQPTAPASLRSPADCLHVAVPYNSAVTAESVFRLIWIPTFIWSTLHRILLEDHRIEYKTSYWWGSTVFSLLYKTWS